MPYKVDLGAYRPVITKTETYSMKHVAVMDAHNLSGDFIAPFGVHYPTECTLNPSPTGIVFFRWHRPHTLENETTEAAQLRYFQSLHEAIGLDAVVVFGENGYTHLHQGWEIASGVRNIDPEIRIFLHSYYVDKEVDAYYEGGRQLFDVISDQRSTRCDDSVKLLTSLLDLPIQTSSPISYKDDWSGCQIIDDYERKYPNIRQPEKFAAQIPSRPPVSWPKSHAPADDVA